MDNNVIENYPIYDSYQDSGVDWLGRIPKEWNLLKLKQTVSSCINGVWGNDPAESNNTIVLRVADFDRNKLVISDDKLTYRYIQKKDILSRKLKKGDLLLEKSGGGDKTLVGCVVLFDKEYQAVTSNFVAKMSPLEEYDSKFLTYVFNTLYSLNINLFSIKQTTGIQNIDANSYLNETFCFPALEVQRKIVNFLDNRTKKLDESIYLKQQQIEKLETYKQTIIQNAVTKGLDLKIQLKDSSVDWIGSVPEHWEVKRLKYVLTERNERTITGEEPLFMVSQKHGLVVRADYHEKATVAFSNIDNKIVCENDLVFNKLKAHLGVFYKSEITFKGIVSPDYAVYKRKAYIDDLKFLEILFRHPSYIKQFIVRATGIVEGLIRLYTSELFDLHIAIPPSNEQKEILEFSEKITTQVESAKNVLQHQIEKLREYKTVLINDAVTGKIKVS